VIPPLFLLGQPVGKRPPLVLPRGLGCMVDLGTGHWPKVLVIPKDAGLLDLACAYWHQAGAANDEGPYP
jgi:hypothetical protein